MGFTHGKSTKVFINGYDLTAYFDSTDISATTDTAETSAFGNTAKTYLAGQKTGTLGLEGFFDSAAGAVDPILRAAIGTEYARVSVYPEGDAYGKYGSAISSIANSYSIKGTIDNATRISAQFQSCTSIERVVSLHALTQVTATGSSTVLDNAASSANGGSAYIHVTESTGSVVVKLEHSADNNTFADLVTFVAIATDNTSQRVEFAGTVNRYVKATWTLDGGETLTAQIGFHRG